MGDFYQNGLVTTLHNFRQQSLESLEKKLTKFKKRRPMGLIIPSLFSELDKPALKNIVHELKQVPYLDEIVIGLDRATVDEFKFAKEYFSELPQHHRVIWNDGPRMQELNQMLLNRKINAGEEGKGRNVWFCFGYMISSARSEAIALHDADIVTYKREMLARLFYPVVDPTFNFKFCKGYYFRCDDEKINGRVVRLLVTPLLRTLKKFFGEMAYLEYLDSFRYPLAGEFSMRADVLKTIRIPSDWGLEIGILSEVERNNAINRICQVEIADRYDHKHQDVSYGNPHKGLSRMSFDISRAIFSKLSSVGCVFSSDTVRSIKATYIRTALDFVQKYQNLAVINGLTLDQDTEERMVDLFAKNIYQAGIEYLEQPNLIPRIPSWKRVISALPDAMELFYEIVEEDNR